MSTILLPKTQHLVVFQEVIRSGSIGSAAKELGLTQPAVSKIINDIEDYFGVELVVRKNTGVTLTPAGQLLLSRSESITREMKNMVNEGNDSNLLIVFYVQIMPDDFVMQLHR
ncbi:LysR family transcriptional regulator, partial [Escherichia coli]